jgi:hypothetical protein
MAGIPQVITEDRASGAQFIDGSLKFDGSTLTRTPGSAGNRKTWTISTWIKRDAISAYQHPLLGGGNGTGHGFNMRFSPSSAGTDTLQIGDYTSSWQWQLITSRVFRDTGWYHIVVSVDITQSTSSDRVKLYINGTRETSFGTASYPSSSYNTYWNTNALQALGAQTWNGSLNAYYSGRLSTVYFLDGIVAGPEEFGYTDPLTNTWRPKKYEGEFNGPSTGSGTVYSSTSTASNAATMFDGSTSTYASSAMNSGSYQTVTEAPITFTSGSFTYNTNNCGSTGGSNNRYLRLTRQSDNATTEITVNDCNGWTIPSGYRNTVISKIEWKRWSSFENISAVYVDGTMLVDGNFVPAGVNGFYLPLDGNTPIGKDQSGNGNDWTPVNFGGSAALDKATGALPILNTDGGGNTARPGTRNDDYSSDIVMAIPFLGNVNDISADIRGSGSNLSVTTSGSPAADSYPTQWYGSSFNVSTSNYINTIGTTSTFAFLHQPEAAGTIEGWINTNSVNVQGPWFQTSNGTNEVGVMFRQNSTTNMAVQINRGVSGQAIVVDSSVTVALNTWYHWAFVKSADGYAQFFLNGVPTGDKVPISTAAGASNAASTNTSSSYAGRIAKNNGEARGVGMNICDYRAYTIQKYAFDTPFIPASTNPNILPDTPSGISGKSKLTKITDGAVAFDGTGDLLQFNGSGSNPIDFGTGDFTVEAFVYHTGGTDDTIISDASGWTLTYGAGGQLRFYMANGSNPVDANTNFISNKWVHVAVVRNSGTLVFYQNGIGVGSHSYAHDISANGSSTFIGKYHGGTVQNWKGYISNLRVVQGTALYTSNFTPPTEPLTAVTNTKLLCCQSTTSETAAAVTPNAFIPRAGGYRFTTAKIYSSYGGGARAANYTVQWSDDNSSWTDAWSGNMSNNTSCGLQQGTGSGNPGAHRYWRYVEGGATTGHHPRVARIILSDGTTDVNIRVYTSDNCSDNGDYQIGTTSTYEDTTWTSGTNNDATATTFNPFTDDIDAIRGQETGYATLNPLSKNSDIILSNGNLTCTNASSQGWRACGSFGQGRPTSGKYYFETQLITDLSSGTYNHFVGVLIQDNYQFIDGDFGNNANGYLVGTYTGSFRTRNNGSYGPSVTKTTTTGAILQVAIDVDNGKLWFGCDNVWASNSPYSNASPSYGFTAGTPFRPHFAVYGANASMDVNFGQKPFKFPPPDGFQPLNLSTVQPEKLIARPDQYVGVTLYTGSGETVSPRTIELPQAADLVWAKSRDRASSNQIADTVRGNNSVLLSNTTFHAQDPTTQFNGGGVSIIDGKTISLIKGSTNQANNENLNATGQKGVVWSWKAGGSSNTFNIDDVGYANASDVNMNAGALNPYDQSQTWTNYFTGRNLTDAGNAFDGSTSTICQSPNHADAYLMLTYTFTNVTSLRVYANNPTNNTMRLNNAGSYTAESALGATANGGWRDLTSLIPTNGTVTHIEAQSADSNGVNWAAIEVNGNLLINSGVTGLTQYPSIAPTGCSVGTKQGFSIIEYSITGSGGYDSIPHGLSRAPEFGIFKCTDTASTQWGVYYTVNGNNTNWMQLNTTGTQGSNNASGGIAGNAFVRYTDSVVEIDHSAFAASGNAGIGYMWHSVPGLQKFGTYTGTGSADGPFIELGFKPAIFWMKAVSGSDANWVIIDSKRPGYNPDQKTLCPNLSNAENASGATTNDILSNGFKVRGTTDRNASGVTYIYCAWAEAPIVNLYGAQANAR